MDEKSNEREKEYGAIHLERAGTKKRDEREPSMPVQPINFWVNNLHRWQCAVI